MGLPAGSAHPYVYDDTPSETVLAWLAQPAENSKVKVDMRAQFGIVDTVSASCQGSASSFDAYASVRNADTGAELASAVGGAHQGQVWTPWFAAPAGWASVVFVNGGAVQVSGSASTPGNGVSLLGYEYRRYQSGARPFLTTLRMPGHYYDAEIDSEDNWHRLYHPGIGRYLQPEPMLQSPRVVVEMARRGVQMPPYVYAANNPLRYTDPDGLMINIGLSCILLNPDFAKYLGKMSLSCDLQRRQPAPICTKGAARGEEDPTAAIEKLLNDPLRVVNVECSDTAMYNAQGVRIWAYTWNQANQINVYVGGWDPVRAARTLAHELAHVAVNTQYEWTPEVVSACTNSDGWISR